MVDKRYETIWIIEPTHDFSKLKQYTKNIKLITTGNERVNNVQEIISEALRDFSPTEDALVPMGKVSSSLLTGLILGSKFPDETIYIGVYLEGEYIFLPS